MAAHFEFRRGVPNLFYRDLVILASPHAPPSSLELSPFAYDAILSIARSERVFGAVYESIGRSRPDWPPLPCSSAHAGYADKITRRKTLLRREQRFLGAACLGLSLGVSFLKGFGVEALYPPGANRDASDIDILTGDCDDFWKLAVVLVASGYELHSAAFAYTEGQLVGEVQFRQPHGHQLKVDCLVGCQPLSSTSWIAYGEEFWAEQRHVAGRVPSAAHSLVVQLAEIYERRQICLRDVFDIASICSHLDSSAIGHVSSKIRACGLISPLKVAAVYAREMAIAIPEEQISNMSQVLLRTGRHEESSNASRAALDLPDLPRKTGGGTRLVAGTFYPFVPTGTGAAGKLKWPKDASRLLRTPIGCFRIPEGVNA